MLRDKIFQIQVYTQAYRRLSLSQMLMARTPC